MSGIDEKLKEASALASMQKMIEKYAANNSLCFDEVMKKYVASESYSALFDFSTGLWREGPDYLLEWYESELKKNE